MSAPTPPGNALNEDKTWILVAHFGGAAGTLIGAGAGGWVAPLVALIARGNVSPVVRAHAVAALNFQLLVSIVGIVGWFTICFFIGFLFILAAVVVGAIFGILAGVKANEGQFYQYPFTLPLVK